MNMQVCRDPSDAAALYLPQRLYLKSFAKINISVQLPSHKVHGKSISNWELMEKLRKMILPDSFSVLKVSKHSLEVIRFEAELESPVNLSRVLARLDDRVVQLKEYPDQLKVRVCEAKSEFPNRHDWDSFFRDTTEMDEMKPGERPDTIHISNLPIKWFIHDSDEDEDAFPTESLVKKIFEKFGAVRQVDIPASDPYRMQMKTAMRGITIPPQEAALYFEMYVQFSEYVGFVRCMDALRGRKLLRKCDDIAEWCGIKVVFDTTKHMTDAAVKRRSIVRERLTARQQAKDNEEKAEKEKIAKREFKERQKYECTEREKLERTKEREERRKKKQLAKLMQSDNLDLNSRVAEEQNKLIKVQKKMQAIRLIEELFKRIELRPELQRNGSRDDQYYLPGERTARVRIIDKFKKQQQDLLEEQRNNYRNALNGRMVIRSALETKKPKRESSLSSVSSDGRGRDGRDSHKHIKTERLTTPEREMEYNKTTAAGIYSMPYGFGYPFYPPGYAYPPQTSMYYSMRGQYYAPPGELVRRGRGGRGGRGRGRGGRMPHFDGPDANRQYYRYFKRLTEQNPHSSHEDRTRARSHSRRREYSRSRSRRRSYSRSRSRSRRSRSRSRRSRRSRSRSRRSRSYSRSRSRSHRRSRSRRSRSKSQRSHRSHRSRSKSQRSHRSRSKSQRSHRSRSKSQRLHRSPSKSQRSDRSRSKSQRSYRSRSKSQRSDRSRSKYQRSPRSRSRSKSQRSHRSHRSHRTPSPSKPGHTSMTTVAS